MQGRNAFAPYQFFLTLMGCLMPVTVCWYLASADPLFKVKSVEFTHPDVVVIVVVMVAFARALVKGFDPLPRPLLITLLLFLGSTLLSSVVAEDKLRALSAVIQIFEFGMLLWAFSAVTEARYFRRIVHFILAVFVFQTLVAVGQFLGGVPTPKGTFYHHQEYAMLTTAATAIALALFAGERVGWKRFLYFVTLLILLVGSLLGQERAPWASFLVVGVVVVAYAGKRKKAVLIGFAATVLAGVLLVVSIPDLREATLSRMAEAQASTESENSLLGRLLIWGIAFKLFLEHPILGVGPKNFVTMVPHLASTEEMMGNKAVDPHNAFVEYLAEQGIIGFLTYVAFCIAIVRLGLKPLRQKLSALHRSLCLTYLAYNVYWLLMLYSYFSKEMAHVHFMIVGLMVGLQRSFSQLPGPSTRVSAEA